MVHLSILSLLVVASLAATGYGAVGAFMSNMDQYWEQFKATHGKQYNARTGEEAGRRKTFEKNVMAVLQHNLEADLNLRPFKLGVNQYADMTSREFQKKMLGFKAPAKVPATLGAHRMTAEVAAPALKDWRADGVVGPVKDQGQCGSCWTFSAVAAVEGANAKANGAYVELSEQNLVDCAKGGDFISNGCDGGLMSEGFQYIMKNKGVSKGKSYPYEEKQGACRYNATNKGASIAGYKDIPQGDEKALEHAVGTVGPVSVAIDAGSMFFQFYSSGVYEDFLCDPSGLNHGVTAVGYGTSKDGKDYWIVRNSWGPAWGDKGYIMMARGKNLCGIAEMASYPIM